MDNIFGEVIYSYTRAQAIEDGVLVDLSKWAKELGIRFPVAVTDTVFNQYLVPSKEVESFGQDLVGRIWDLLSLFRFAIHNGRNADRVMFTVSFVMDKRGRKKNVEFKALCHGGDAGEPVITIMLPQED